MVYLILGTLLVGRLVTLDAAGSAPRASQEAGVLILLTTKNQICYPTAATVLSEPCNLGRPGQR